MPLLAGQAVVYDDAFYFFRIVSVSLSRPSPSGLLSQELCRAQSPRRSRPFFLLRRSCLLSRDPRDGRRLCLLSRRPDCSCCLERCP